MSKHESGTVRVIPADYSHWFHQINRYDFAFSDATTQRPQRSSLARELIKPVETIHEPGRHRVETVPTNIATVFVTAPSLLSCVPAFECVREHDGDMAIGFEYLPV